MSFTFRGLVVLVLLALASPARAQFSRPYGDSPERAEYIRSHYTKFEYRIPMRDGTKLFTSVYVPNDASPGKRYPVLLTRTPYTVAPYGTERYAKRLGPTAQYEKDGFIFAFQDVRGQHMSEGQFVDVRPQLTKKGGPKDIDESTDTYDTIEWLVKNLPHNNGRVGQWGISYPGFYASAGAINSHPALKAVSPQAPIADWFWDDMHRHGAFNLVLAFNFFSGFGKPRPVPTDSEEWKSFEHGTPDGYQFFLDMGPLSNADTRYFKGDIAFWKDFVAHPNYDAFWQSRNLLPHLKNIKAAVMTVGGWYDTGTARCAPTPPSRSRTRASPTRSSWAPGRTVAGRARTAPRWGMPSSASRRATSTRRWSSPSSSTTSRGATSPTCPRPWCSRRVPTAGGASTPGRRNRPRRRGSTSSPRAACRTWRPRPPGSPSTST
jgi:hypothetical protein